MPVHQPVMPVEALAALDAGRGGLFVDATLGLGGHTELILRASPNAHVIGIDKDAEAIALAKERLREFGERFEAVKSDYRQIKTVIAERGIESVAGVLADLGVSSFQFDEPERGFSFKSDSPLDMRMDRSQSLTATDLVNGLSERELADVIYEFGEERASRRIARLIVAERAKAAIKTTAQLANLVVKAVFQSRHRQPGHWRIHPATKTFQALRIAVNRELDDLDKFVADAVDLLAVGSRFVVITFHSLEDRIIKQALKFQSGHCVCPQNQPVCQCGAAKRIEILTRKAVQPGDAEIAANPRARSAKLRVCQKLK